MPKAKKGRRGPGRNGMIGKWFERRNADRRKRRAGEKAGRKAARRRK